MAAASINIKTGSEGDLARLPGIPGLTRSLVICI